MKKLGSLSAILIIVLAILSSCTNSTSVPRTNVTVSLSNYSAESRNSVIQSRTLLPSEIPDIKTYRVSLIKVEGDRTSAEPYTELFPGDSSEFSFNNVELGTYTVRIYGYADDLSEEPVVIGESDSNYTVSVDGTNTIEVALDLVSSGDYTGSASMTFDWSAVTSNEVIKSAMENGGLVFYLHYYDETEKVWKEGGKSKPTGTSATQLEFIVYDLPVSTGLRLKYSFATTAGIVINPVLTTTIAQIYSNLISVQQGTDGKYIYYISDGEISDGTNILDPTLVEDDSTLPEGSIKFTWKNQMQDGVCLFDKVIVGYTASSTGTTAYVEVSVSGESGECVIENLTVGEEYTITFQAHHTSGLISPVFTYPEKVKPVALVGTPVVTANASGASIIVSWDIVKNAVSYTVERMVDSGSFEVIKTNLAETTYTDSILESGHSYSYRIQAVGENDKKGEYSETTTPIEISGSSITIKPPTLEDDFQIEFEDMPDVLVIKEGESLTFSVKEDSRITAYAWYLNDSTTPKSTERSVTIYGSDTRNDLKNGLNTLILEVTTGGKKYSSMPIKFGVGEDVLDSGIKISHAGGRISSESSEGVARTFNLSQYVTVKGDENVIKDVTYSVTGGNKELASVNPKTGVITFNNPADETTDFSVTITATSFSGKTADITFNVYKATIDSAEELINLLNIEFNKIFDDAAIGDWWTIQTGDTDIVYSKNNVEISSPHTTGPKPGYIKFTEYTTTLDSTVKVILSTPNYIEIYPSDEFGSGWNSGWWITANDKLSIVGSNNSSNLNVELPYNQGTVTIRYENINVENINVENSNRAGTYHVTFTQTIGYSESLTGSTSVPDSSIPTALNPNMHYK